MANQVDEVCPNCKGTGKVMIEDKRGKRNIIDCPICKGSGIFSYVELTQADYDFEEFIARKLPD